LSASKQGQANVCNCFDSFDGMPVKTVKTTVSTDTRPLIGRVSRQQQAFNNTTFAGKEVFTLRQAAPTDPLGTGRHFSQNYRQGGKDAI
jgi:hypothetical protein